MNIQSIKSNRTLRWFLGTALLAMTSASPSLAQIGALQPASWPTRLVPCNPANPCPPSYPGSVLPGYPTPSYPTPSYPGSIYNPANPQAMPGQTPSTLPEGTFPNQPGQTAPLGQQPAPNMGGLGDPALQGGDQFARAEARGGQGAANFDANMFGDLIGIMAYQSVPVSGRFEQVQVGTRTVIVTLTPLVTRQVPIFATVPVNNAIVRAPVVNRYNGFKITDNDSPRPVDRVYYTFNSFNNVGIDSSLGQLANASINRHVIGFEKAFMEGDASFGMRLPFISLSGTKEIEQNVTGDLSLIFKYAFYNNRISGDVASVGMVVTVPTGDNGFLLENGQKMPNSVLIQPWVGGISHITPDLYIMGFSSLVVPTNSLDPTIWFNSLGAGYWLYRNPGDRLIQGIVPVAEFHVNTPLNRRSEENLIFVRDQVNFTGGCHFVLPRLTIGGAIGVPLVGPRPYDVEAIGTVNFRF